MIVKLFSILIGPMACHTVLGAVHKCIFSVQTNAHEVQQRTNLIAVVKHAVRLFVYAPFANTLAHSKETHMQAPIIRAPTCHAQNGKTAT